MSNRLNRDQILHRALDEVDNPALDKHDRPGGSINPNKAFSIAWLQDGLDSFHRIFPMAGRLTSTSVTLNSTGSLSLPTDFIIDVRDGLVIPATRARVFRKGFQDWLNLDLRNVANATQPTYYTRQGSVIRYTPAPVNPVTATLWYYALPTVLDENDRPDFPDDKTLVEYVKLRGLEHVRAINPGSADTYVNQAIAAIRAAGLFADSENDTFVLDPVQFPRSSQSPYDWMGSTTA